MTKKISVRALQHAEATFIVKGKTRGDLHEVAPWCNAPRVIQIATKKGAIPNVVRNAKNMTQLVGRAELNIAGACRRCAGCLTHKRKLWTARAYGETTRSTRTWFGTLTFRPELHDEALRACYAKLWDDGLEYGQLTEAQQLAVNAEVLYGPVQRFLKRLRKGDEDFGPAKFRYLIVPEPHKSGLVHFHALLHEWDIDAPLRKAQLEAQWRAGVSHWRLVDTGEKRAVYYVCKYLSKEAEYKPRSSKRYGDPTWVAPAAPRAARPTVWQLCQTEAGETPTNEGDNKVDRNERNEETVTSSGEENET